MPQEETREGSQWFGLQNAGSAGYPSPVSSLTSWDWRFSSTAAQALGFSLGFSFSNYLHRNLTSWGKFCQPKIKLLPSEPSHSFSPSTQHHREFPIHNLSQPDGLWVARVHRGGLPARAKQQVYLVKTTAHVCAMPGFFSVTLRRQKQVAQVSCTAVQLSEASVTLFAQVMPNYAAQPGSTQLAVTRCTVRKKKIDTLFSVCDQPAQTVKVSSGKLFVKYKRLENLNISQKMGIFSARFRDSDPVRCRYF